MLRASHLNYSINNKPILNDVSFTLEKGDFAVLMGPNGAGKTTLLKIFAGIVRDYTGAATIHFAHINKLTPKGVSEFVSFVPQEGSLPFKFTALDVVLMGRAGRKKGFGFDTLEDYQLAKTSMQKTDSWHLAERSFDSLSGGEKQRVSLARALTQKAQILLLDEPGNHLDIPHQKSFYQVLENLCREEKMIALCVAHELNLVSQYAGKVIFLKAGFLLSAGPLQQEMTKSRMQEVFETDCSLYQSRAGAPVFIPER
ncbi:ABC transporter ATP-binding protein [bacterium]|nr:ABC transporter ATP-binding protein [bacterium]